MKSSTFYRCFYHQNQTDELKAPRTKILLKFLINEKTNRKTCKNVDKQKKKKSTKKHFKKRYFKFSDNTIFSNILIIHVPTYIIYEKEIYFLLLYCTYKYYIKIILRYRYLYLYQINTNLLIKKKI